MQLVALRLANFQCFGPEPIEFVPDNVTYLIGPNGSGKTALFQALCRLFGFEASLRRVQLSDFHVPFGEKSPPEERQFWIEADFEFPELASEEDNSTVAPHFSHMRLAEEEGVPRVRFRLTATVGADGEIEESLVYVLEVQADDSPLITAVVPRGERHYIHVHYVPARRDPSEHIAHGTNALLGRLLRAANWDNEREQVRALADQISESLARNPSISALSSSLKFSWDLLHKSDLFADPRISFGASEIEALVKHMSVSFWPGHGGQLVDYSRLSDGQKSILYLSLVLASQMIDRAVLAEDDPVFDVTKLRPPVFTLVALEEPENSLSPHYLGRIIGALEELASKGDAQALLATHAPSMLRRVAPERIRYLRLTEKRTTRITRIRLPDKETEAHKFVREAIQAFPEVYFSRLVVLGEGDSEELVLPRLFKAMGVSVDENAVSIAPLGGRHVNHFWRLLSGLEIPFLTLLDLDVARHDGGWGRIRYVNMQLGKIDSKSQLPEDYSIPAWNSAKCAIRDYRCYLEEMEKRGIYFSEPLDLDFAMLHSYPEAYGVECSAIDSGESPNETTLKSVLGKNHGDYRQYEEKERRLFSIYHRRFKLGSKPAAHFEALAQLSEEQLLQSMPESLVRLAKAVRHRLKELPS